MTRTALRIGSTLKGKNCSQGEQILSSKSRPYGKEAKYYMLMTVYHEKNHTHFTHMRDVRNECYAYDGGCFKFANLIYVSPY